MVGNALTLLWMWGYWILGRAFLGTIGSTQQRRWLSFPLGYAIVVIVAHQAWLVGVPMRLLHALFLSAALVSAYLLRHTFSWRWRRPHFSLWTTSFTVFGALLFVWPMFVSLNAWDHLALYGLRARMIASGQAFLPDFVRLFQGTSDQAYPFSHPFGSSVVWGLVDWAGGRPALIAAGLVASFLAGILSTWRSAQARALFALFFFLNPVVLQAVTEGYPAWSAALWLCMALLLLKQFPDDQRFSVVSVWFVAASTAFRVTEAHWLVVLLAVSLLNRTANRKISVVLSGTLLMTLLLQWQWWNIRFSSILPYVGSFETLAPMPSLARLSLSLNALVSSNLFWLGLLTWAIVVWQRVWTPIVQAVWLAWTVFFLGVVMLVWWQPHNAVESLQALSRAAFPVLLGLIFVWSEIVEYNDPHGSTSAHHRHHAELHARSVHS